MKKLYNVCLSVQVLVLADNEQLAMSTAETEASNLNLEAEFPTEVRLDEDGQLILPEGWVLGSIPYGQGDDEDQLTVKDVQEEMHKLSKQEAPAPRPESEHSRAVCDGEAIAEWRRRTAKAEAESSALREERDRLAQEVERLRALEGALERAFDALERDMKSWGEMPCSCFPYLLRRLGEERAAALSSLPSEPAPTVTLSMEMARLLLAVLHKPGVRVTGPELRALQALEMLVGERWPPTQDHPDDNSDLPEEVRPFFSPDVVHAAFSQPSEPAVVAAMRAAVPIDNEEGSPEEPSEPAPTPGPCGGENCVRHVDGWLHRGGCVFSAPQPSEPVRRLDTAAPPAKAKHVPDAWTDEPADQLEAAWGLIANAHGGEWERASAEWQEAAARWQERFFRTIHALKSAPAFAPPNARGRCTCPRLVATRDADCPEHGLAATYPTHTQPRKDGE